MADSLPELVATFRSLKLLRYAFSTRIFYIKMEQNIFHLYPSLKELRLLKQESTEDNSYMQLQKPQYG
jgi:hypothetical protein